jgi:O-antigen/teichoic acid export membrane protein
MVLREGSWMKRQWRVKHLLGLVVLAAFNLVAYRLVAEMFNPRRSTDQVQEFLQLLSVMLFFATPFFLVGGGTDAVG